MSDAFAPGGPGRDVPRLSIGRCLALCAGAALVLWGAGLLTFLRARAVVSFTLPARDQHPVERHNLALFTYGPTLSASSYDHWLDHQHHPAFAVDGFEHPSPIEKWASSPGDRAPWLEIAWERPALVDTVRLRHAGWKEAPQLTAERYSLTCIGGATDGRSFSVEHNVEPVVSHTVACDGATGLRLSIWPNGPRKVVRLYEIEVWGISVEATAR